MMKKIIGFYACLCFMLCPVMTYAVNASVHTKSSKHQVKRAQHKKQAQKKPKEKKSLAGKHKKTSKKMVQRKKTTHKIAAIPNVRPFSGANNDYSPPKFKHSFMASMKDHLVNYVHKTVSTLSYSMYKLGGRKYDVSHGVYVVDCSEYVDNILQEIYPDAFFNLVDSTGADKPTTQHYYDFFNTLNDDPSRYWNKINNVEKLEAGDILVFRYSSLRGRNRGGHVMVVMDKPVFDSEAYLVRVADSAPSGHSEDTRPGRVSGIGIGTLVLRADPMTGQPSAYAWKIGARWNENVKIAMARPIAD